MQNNLLGKFFPSDCDKLKAKNRILEFKRKKITRQKLMLSL